MPVEVQQRIVMSKRRVGGVEGVREVRGGGGVEANVQLVKVKSEQGELCVEAAARAEEAGRDVFVRGLLPPQMLNVYTRKATASRHLPGSGTMTHF